MPDMNGSEDFLDSVAPAEARRMVAKISGAEGPNPEGVAARLRRERDETREECETLRAELQTCKRVENIEWLLLSQIAEAIRDRRENELVTMDKDLMRRIVVLYLEARGVVLGDDPEDFGELLPEGYLD